MRAVRLRQTINWLNLSTPLGLLVARTGGASLHRGPHGVILAADYRSRIPAPNAPAVTIGDVVLLRMSVEQARAREAMLEHEARHAVQYAFWIGPIGFLPAYLLASGWSWWHTRSFALRNAFEVRAGLVDGGYVSAGSEPAPGADRGQGA